MTTVAGMASVPLRKNFNMLRDILGDHRETERTEWETTLESTEPDQERFYELMGKKR